MKHPTLIVQAALGAVQVVVNGTALDGVGFPHTWTILAATLVGAAQLGLALYQRGLVEPIPPIPAEATAAIQPPVVPPTTP